MKQLLIFLLFIIFIFQGTAVNSAENSSCVDEQILSEQEKTARFNNLSFPAVPIDDPYIIATSYFNSKMDILVKENYVTHFEYSGVPYPVYKSFLNSEAKKDFYEKCITDNYEVRKLY